MVRYDGAVNYLKGVDSVTADETSDPMEDESRDEPLDPRKSDTFLLSLIRLVNANDEEGPGITFPMSLLVGGTIVTGVLVSVQEYFDNFGTEIEQGFKFPSMEPEAAARSSKMIGDAFRQWAEDAREAQKKDPDYLPRYIHLRDARILFPDKLIPENRAIWWRGKVDVVDGFVLGTFGPPVSQ